MNAKSRAPRTFESRRSFDTSGPVLRALLSLFFALSGLVLAGPPPVYKPDFTLFAEGRDVYERNCVLCHGPRGDGNGELSAGLLPKPRSFREGLFKFRTTPWDKLPADADLRKTIKGGLSGTAMGMFTQLREDEITSVIEYLKSFSRRWRKPENYAEPVQLPAAPEWLAKGPVPTAHLQEGHRLFESTCAACHGPKADGKGPAAIALKDVWGLAARPSDLRQPHLRCGDAPKDIFRVLETGLNGTPMVSFATVLTPGQRWDIIAYVLSLRIAGPPTL